MTAVRRDLLRLERRYRQHVHAVGSPVRRAGKPNDDCQGTRRLSAGFGNAPLDVKQMLRGDFFLVYAEFAAHQIGGEFRHQAVCHQFAAGDAHKTLDAIARFVVEADYAPADAAACRVAVVCDQRPNAGNEPT